jgi:hypothetical protein
MAKEHSYLIHILFSKNAPQKNWTYLLNPLLENYRESTLATSLIR